MNKKIFGSFKEKFQNFFLHNNKPKKLAKNYQFIFDLLQRNLSPDILDELEDENPNIIKGID